MQARYRRRGGGGVVDAGGGCRVVVAAGVERPGGGIEKLAGRG